MNTQSPSISNFALTALAPVIWGSTYIVASEILPPDRPFTAALIRVLPAGLILILLCRQLPKRNEWLKLIVLSALNIGAFQALLFISAYRLPGGQAAVISAIQPLLLMFLTWSLGHQKVSGIAIVAGFASIAGMSLLFLSPNFVFDAIGISAAFLSAVSLALGTWFVRSWNLSLPIKALTGWQLFLGGLMITPIAYFKDQPLPTLNVTEVMGYVYICLAGAMLSYFLWFRGMSKLSSVSIGSLSLLSPITAVILGWVILGQSISPIGLFGLTITLVSIFVIQRNSSPVVKAS